jgi:L,D-transpeptidase YbiS
VKKIIIEAGSQKLSLYKKQRLLCQYSVRTATNGLGETQGSFKTPRGKHIIRSKVGAGEAAYAVFKSRRPTGEILTEKLFCSNPNRDWILGRILWLSGTEIGVNRLGDVDTMRRYIYIHGSPEQCFSEQAGSKGCIRMLPNDIVALFDQVAVGDTVEVRY